MRLHEFITELDTSSIGKTLSNIGTNALAAVTGSTSAQAGEQMKPAEFGGVERWDTETKKLEARLQPIFNRLLRVAGPDAQKFRNIRFTVGSVPGKAASYEDGVIAFDVSVYYDLSDDTIAYVMGHEMAHLISNAPSGYRNLTQQQAHKKEYDADIYGAKLAHRAGYNPQKAYADFNAAAKRAKASRTHPNYKSRVDKVKQSTGINVATLQNLQHNTQAVANYINALA